MRYRINYSRVISQANSISDDASKLNEQIKRLSQAEQDIRSSWKGQAADAFLSRLSLLINEMNRTRLQMSNLSSTIRYCADRIRREDEEAARRAAALRTSRS